MTLHDRRAFLTRAAAVAAGSGVVAMTANKPAAGSDSASIHGSYAGVNWTEWRGGPQRTSSVNRAPVVDADSPNCRRFYEGPFAHTGEGVVNPDTETMYLTDDAGRLVALDTRVDGSEDGTASRQWQSDDLGVTGTPSLAHDHLYAHGDTQVVAYDLESREVAWNRTFDGEIEDLLVAYQRVYVAAGGELYALSPDNGGLDWANGDDGYETLAAGHGEIFVIRDARWEDDDTDIASIDPETGADVWQYPNEVGWRGYDQHGPIAIVDGRFACRVDGWEVWVFEYEDRENFVNYEGAYKYAIDDEAIVSTSDYHVSCSYHDEDHGWSYRSGNLHLSRATIAGDTVYVFNEGDGGSQNHDYELIAFDKPTGEVEWSCYVTDHSEPFLGMQITVTERDVWLFGRDDVYVTRGDAPESTPTPTETETPTGTEPSSQSPTATETLSTTETPTASPTPPETGAASPSATEIQTSTKPTPTPATETATATTTEAEAGAAVRTRAETETQPDDMPGFGVGGAVTAIGGVLYVLKRRLRDDN